MTYLALAVLLFSPPAPTQDLAVTNGGFEEGAGESPAGWTLSGGTGAWETTGHSGRRCISVSGATGSSNHWRTPDLTFEPGALYRVSVWIRTAPGTTGGCIVTGPDFANRDYSVGQAWEERSFVFRAPDAPRNVGFLRFGQWQLTGTVYFDDVRLTRVQPLHRQAGGIELGAGESVEQGTYRAALRFDYEGSNSARCLLRSNATFNSNRFWLTGETAVVYHHVIGALEQTSGLCRVNCGYHERGTLVVEASGDGLHWTEIGRLEGVGRVEAPLPDEMLPAQEAFIRLRCEGDSSLQVHGYEYEAGLPGAAGDLQGQTCFLELTRPNADFLVTSLGDMLPGRDNRVILAARNAPAGTVTVEVTPESGPPFRTETRIAGGGPLALPYELSATGQTALRVTVRTEAAEPLFEAVCRFTVPETYAANYGYLLRRGPGGIVWWCEAPYKVSRERPAPSAERAEVAIEVARNEYEAAQVVVRPTQDLQGLTASVSDLSGPGGASLPASALSIDAVEYVRVRVPTDETGSEGWWPDPLPPLSAPIDVQAGQNQPLWVTAHIPKNARAGDYRGPLTLSAEGWREQVPLRVHVFDFTLPDETHVESGFGLDPGAVQQYHNLEAGDELRQVFDLYLRNFAAHRISPYNPTPFDPIRVSFSGVTWEGGKIVTDQQAGGKASMQVTDDTPTGVVDAHTAELIAVDPGQDYVLRWAAKTEAGHQYLVTLNTYDSTRNWISGNNKDFAATGTGDWAREERDLRGRFDDRVRYVSLTLRPALWTEDGANVGTAWFDDCELSLAAGGPNLIPNAGFETTDEALDVQVDFTDFDRAAEYAFNELHLRNFALPVQGMGGGSFHSRYLGRIGPYEQGTPGYERLMAKYLTTIQDHLEAKGWLDKQYIYWFDEPDAKDYDFVRQGMELLKRSGPKLRRMLTEEPVPPLFGAVDLWCPVLSNMDPEICAQRKQQGEDIWWYVCTGPRAPYPTLFIDHNATELRVWLWMTWKWGLDGILVWHTNYWHSPAAYYQGKPQNPWDDPMSYVSGYDYKPGQIAYWGNGDGRFLYPPNRKAWEDKARYMEGPVNSLRWEMLRDGIEDYEYLYLLRSLAEKAGGPNAEVAKLLEVPESIVVDKTHFTRDPLPILQHRRRVAEAIEGM